MPGAAGVAFFVACLEPLALFGGGFSRLRPPKAGLDRGF